MRARRRNVRGPEIENSNRVLPRAATHLEPGPFLLPPQAGKGKERQNKSGFRGSKPTLVVKGTAWSPSLHPQGLKTV